MTALRFEAPECPGEDCPSCTGEVCLMCGAGCWNTFAVTCDHDVIDRHHFPGEQVTCAGRVRKSLRTNGVDTT